MLNFLMKSKNTILSQPKVDGNELLDFFKKYGGNHLTHLVYLNDKQVFWAQNRKVLFIYRQTGKKVVVLGDPVGEESLIYDAIIEFQSMCYRCGFSLVFYQIGSRFMNYYKKLGYRFFKVGEEPKVDLKKFTLSGKKSAKLRTSMNKFNREGYQFKVISPPYSDKMLSEMKKVSDSWLGDRDEKSFSVTSFQEDYVSRFQVAILLDSEERLVAFTTLPIDFNNSSRGIVVDLMRNCPKSTNGTMDVLFSQIFNWAQEKGYEYCSLGMAPLSNVGNHQKALKSEKLARFVYLYGESFYKFKGLRDFKAKFAHEWEPKYLAYKNTFLPSILFQLIRLIHQKPRKTYAIEKKVKYSVRDVG